MRVLDIDLDFFVSKIAYFRADVERLDSQDYRMQSIRTVRKFLEDRCLLNRATPVPGRIVEHHDEAFYFWRELINSGDLTAPFSVTHVDAHADLGLGDRGYVYLMGELLHLPVERRVDPIRSSDGMGPGNYLAFAVACRWIKEINFVPHPKSRQDLMPYHFLGYDTSSGVIELKSCNPDAFKKIWFEATDEGLGVIAREPHVRFVRTEKAKFRAVQPFDKVVVSRSPGFTPAEADGILGEIRRYVREI